MLNLENLNNQLKKSLHLTFKFPRLLKRSVSNVSRYALERSVNNKQYLLKNLIYIGTIIFKTSFTCALCSSSTEWRLISKNILTFLSIPIDSVSFFFFFPFRNILWWYAFYKKFFITKLLCLTLKTAKKEIIRLLIWELKKWNKTSKIDFSFTKIYWLHNFFIKH